MLRAIASVIVGYALWTALWLGGNAAFFAEAAKADRIDAPGVLVGLLGLGLACSLAAGASAGAIGRRTGPVIVLGLLLLVTGAGVQLSVWSRMPLWYHAPFVLLLVPVTVAGARLVGVGRGTLAA